MSETYKSIIIGSYGIGGGPGTSTNQEIQWIELDQLPHRVLRDDEVVPSDLVDFIFIDAITGEKLVPIRLFGK